MERNEDYTNRIFPLIVEGKPHQEDGSPMECFPPILNNLKDLCGDKVELIAGDITATGRNHAFVKILAGTLRKKRIQFSELWNRYEQSKLEQEKKEREEKNRLLLMESRLIAEKSLDLIEQGDSYLAQLLLLSVITDENDSNPRPYCAEVESAMRKANIHKSTIMKSNGSWIKKMKFSSNGKYIAVQDGSEIITIWNTTNGAKIFEFGGIHSLESVDFSPNSELFVFSNSKFDIEFYDLIAHKKLPLIFQGHTDVINSISFSPDGTKIVSTSKDKTILVWNVNEKCKSLTIKWRGVSFEHAKYTHNSKKIITISRGASIVIWDAETGEAKSPTLKGHRYTINGFSISPSDQFLLTWGGEGAVILWDLTTYCQRFKIRKINPVVGALFTPDEQKIITALGTSFMMWNTINGEQVGKSIEVHNSHITAMDINRDGTYILTGHFNGDSHLWYTNIKDELPESLCREKDLQFHDYSNSINHLKFNPVENTFCSGAYDRTVRMREYIADTKATNVKRFWNGVASASAYNPENSLIVSASSDDYVILLYNSKTGKLIRQWNTLHTDRIRHIAFNSNATVIATVSHDRSVYLWDVATGDKILGPLYGHCGWIVMCVFSPDNGMLATASSDGEIRLWNVDTGECIYKFNADFENMSHALSFDSSGGLLAYGSNNEVKIMDIKNRLNIITFHGHTDSVTDLAFSPDNKTLATASNDQSVRLWDIMSGKQVGSTMKRHGSTVESVRFNHEGTKLVSADFNGTIIIWDVMSTIPLGYPLYGRGRSYHAEFSSDDSIIYVYGFDHHFFEYKNFHELVDQSSSTLNGRELSLEEMRQYKLI